MPIELLNDIVQTDYGQFDLIWDIDELGYDGNNDRFFAGQVNGLVGARAPGCVYVRLARRSGGSSVWIVLHQIEPKLDSAWEDVVEVSAVIPAGSAPKWQTWSAHDYGSLDLPSGDYRIRVSARGRDAGKAGEYDDEIVDFYLIELWRTLHLSTDAILRTSSENARAEHRHYAG